MTSTLQKLNQKLNKTLRFLLLFALLTSCGVSAPEDRQPNIVMILADDLGYMDTTIYGSKLYETPNIDALAARGILFTNAYSASPLCSPSRASLLTGMQPGRLRLTTAAGHLPEEVLDPVVPTSSSAMHRALEPQSRTRLPADAYTYAQKLKEVGYSTAFIGKWHLGPPPFSPENHGFDVVVGGRQHPGPPPPGSYFAPWNAPGLTEYKAGTHISEALAQEAMTFISAHKNQPFLLNLWYYDVHSPYQTEANLLEKYREKVSNGVDSEQRSPEMAAMIASLDNSVGQVLSHLEAEDLLDNTVIIFTSDNGGNMYDRINGVPPTDNAPLRGGKGINYEGGVKVPLIVSYPPLIAKNSITDFVSSAVDLFPTILELANITTTQLPHDGVSLVNVMRQSSGIRKEPIYSHFPHYVTATNNIPNTSVREGDWKLYKFYADSNEGEDRHELYNLKTDPGESKNLADTHLDLTDRLGKLIDRNNLITKSLVPVKNPNVGNFGLDFWRIEGAEAYSATDTLILKSSSVDPMLVATAPVINTSTLTLTFEMKSESEGHGQLFWTTHSDPHFSESNSKTFQVQHDGLWHEYTVSISEAERIGLLRLDPSTNLGEIQIRGIVIQD
jgi:arylsulfatase A-like enzyme